MQIYVRRNQKRAGPFTLEEINRHLAAGALEPTDEAWSEGSPGWKPLLHFPGVIFPGGASSTAATIAIAAPKDIVVPKFAGFWVRGGAFIVDLVLIALLAAAVLFVFAWFAPGMSILRALLLEAVCLLYMPLFWASRAQATPGQRLFALRVVNAEGARIAAPQAVLRFAALIFSAALAGIGLLMVAFRPDKRGLHDLIARTQVVPR